MNERITQLRIEAMQYANSADISDIYKDWYSAFEEKFAKLIVLECADLIHKKVGAKSALDILDHFGLE
jgi:hypothetical protein